eukprot:SAG22_NODE_23_length_31399_cov_35.631313_13_plen_225_part_00
MCLQLTRKCGTESYSGCPGYHAGYSCTAVRLVQLYSCSAAAPRAALPNYTDITQCKKKLRTVCVARARPARRARAAHARNPPRHRAVGPRMLPASLPAWALVATLAACSLAACSAHPPMPGLRLIPIKVSWAWTVFEPQLQQWAAQRERTFTNLGLSFHQPGLNIHTAPSGTDELLVQGDPGGQVLMSSDEGGSFMPLCPPPPQVKVSRAKGPSRIGVCRGDSA